MIRDNIVNIQERISIICKELGRNPADIVLVGVTKYSDDLTIKEAVEAGLTHIGENRVQDARQKFPILETVNAKVTKHLIGHLQTNKVKYAVEIFDLIQSVDSEKLAQEIEKQARKLNKQVDILVQVNTSGEEQKFGSEKDAAVDLVRFISKLEHIRVCGLMTIAPFVDDEEIVRQSFRDLKILFDQFSREYVDSDRVEMQYLSMGMTADFPVALEQGANMIRVGRAIFIE